LVAFAEDPAAFADFGVPLSGLSGEQDFRVCVGKLLRRSRFLGESGLGYGGEEELEVEEEAGDLAGMHVL
jgi:hypothetical protein